MYSNSNADDAEFGRSIGIAPTDTLVRELYMDLIAAGFCRQETYERDYGRDGSTSA